MHRQLGEHLARDLAGARPLGRDRRAPPRPRRGPRPGRGPVPRSRRLRAQHPPDAARHPLLPARDRLRARGRSPAHPLPRSAGERVPDARTTAGARSGSSRRCGGWCAGAATPRAVCLGLLRSARYDFDEGHLARGAGVARQAAEVARSSRIIALEVEAEALITDFLRELGDVQGALAACDRALAAFDPGAGSERAAALARRGAPVARRAAAPRRARARSGRRVRRGDGHLQALRRAAHGGARRRTRSLTRCSCRDGTRTPSRSRSSRSRLTCRSAAASSSPRR